LCVRVALRFFFLTRRVFFFFDVFDDPGLVCRLFLLCPLCSLFVVLFGSSSFRFISLSFAACKSPIASSDFKKKKKAESPTDRRRHFFLRDKKLKLIHTLTRTNAHPTSRSAHSKLKRNTHTHSHHGQN